MAGEGKNKKTAEAVPVAVALSHQQGSQQKPVVTATGRGELAEQILNIAFANDVKVREDADLAQILSEVDVDTPIPLEALAAVSEILSYLYRAQIAPQTSEVEPVTSPPEQEKAGYPDDV